MTDRDKETKHSTLVYDENDSNDPLRTPLQGTLQTNTSTMTQNESTDFREHEQQHKRREFERRSKILRRYAASNHDYADLTSTLPTYSGTDTENLTEWIASLECMRERC